VKGRERDSGRSRSAGERENVETPLAKASDGDRIRGPLHALRLGGQKTKSSKGEHRDSGKKREITTKTGRKERDPESSQ